MSYRESFLWVVGFIESFLLRKLCPSSSLSRKLLAVKGISDARLDFQQRVLIETW